MTRHPALRSGLLGVALMACAADAAASGIDLADRLTREVSAAMARCFEAPRDYAPPYPAVSLLLNFRPDGNLDGPPQLSDPPGGDLKRSATVAAVLVAASRCARIDNATQYRQDYPAWKSLRLVFRPGKD
ncbi:hypothetical protein [Rhizobium sp. C1]|uniref:hypothetical protein n=1 Tax=Rhizobium sp. C1 TaxID=1349799 RepID=UPI001E3E4F8E|nr:hypothetical protein [Rhizobium sp. C1]MCD2177201.1 hypothetical protein [Rhizobium sp. C1]